MDNHSVQFGDPLLPVSWDCEQFIHMQLPHEVQVHPAPLQADQIAEEGITSKDLVHSRHDSPHVI
jgi:hypothetical protein